MSPVWQVTVCDVKDGAVDQTISNGDGRVCRWSGEAESGDEAASLAVGAFEEQFGFTHGVLWVECESAAH